MQKVKQHAHKYERKILGGRKIVFYIDEETGKRKRRLEKTGGYEVYKCAFPGCKSYFPKEIADGAISLCWNCNEELILNKENLKLKRPTHEKCRKTRSVA